MSGARPLPLPDSLPAGLRFDWGGRVGWLLEEAHRWVQVPWITVYTATVTCSTIPGPTLATVMSYQIDWDHWRELTEAERKADTRPVAERLRERIAKMSEADAEELLRRIEAGSAEEGL